jgi:hypothetical protein
MHSEKIDCEPLTRLNCLVTLFGSGLFVTVMKTRLSLMGNCCYQLLDGECNMELG